MTTTIKIEGKEIHLTNTSEDIMKYLESNGAQKINTRIVTKAIDPLTVGVLAASGVGYIWYQLSKESMIELKNRLK